MMDLGGHGELQQTPTVIEAQGASPLALCAECLTPRPAGAGDASSHPMLGGCLKIGISPGVEPFVEEATGGMRDPGTLPSSSAWHFAPDNG